MGYSPWGLKESDTTERLTLHFLAERIEREEIEAMNRKQNHGANV